MLTVRHASTDSGDGCRSVAGTRPQMLLSADVEDDDSSKAS